MPDMPRDPEEWNQCHAPCPEKLNRTAVRSNRLPIHFVAGSAGQLGLGRAHRPAPVDAFQQHR
jgi:hypothetical protein